LNKKRPEHEKISRSKPKETHRPGFKRGKGEGNGSPKLKTERTNTRRQCLGDSGKKSDTHTPNLKREQAQKEQIKDTCREVGKLGRGGGMKKKPNNKEG